ncbi:MAG: HNH endonuclease [Aquisalinus sp.]|nr:HNH endonuclease [Aquisalinus sp.]
MSEWPYNTAAWKKLRRAKLAAEPFCYPCWLRDRYVFAEVVDHIIAIKSGGEAFPPMDGLMSMCAKCHNEKTAGLDRPNQHVSGRRFKGCDEQGNPIDPDDPWHGGAKDHEDMPSAIPTAKSQKYLVCEDDDLGVA